MAHICPRWMRLAMASIVAITLATSLIVACEAGDYSTQPALKNTPLSAASIAAGTILLQESFESNRLRSRGWYDNTRPTATTTEHTDGARSLELHWLPGANTPTSGGTVRHLFPGTSTLYVGYWVKYSANWVGSGNASVPREFAVLSDADGDYDGPASNWLAVYLDQIYEDGGIPRIALQDSKAINTSFGTPPISLVGLTEDRSTAGCNGVTEPNVVTSCYPLDPWYNDKTIRAPAVTFQADPGPGYKGDWNHVEAYYQLNSVVDGVGQADGVVRYWFNGTLVIDRHDIVFRAGARPDIQFHQFIIGPYMGDGSPVDQTMWIDDLSLATAPPDGAPLPASVASVTVNPSSTSISVGEAATLTATTSDSLGNALTGRDVTWVSSNTAVATVSSNGVVTGVAAGSVTITATSEGQSDAATVTVTAATSSGSTGTSSGSTGTSSGPPETVTDLRLVSVTSTSVTLAFTEVNDGTGQPASYDVRWAPGTISWGSATSTTQGTCAVPMTGTAIGATRTCTVAGLAAGTGYQLELNAFRGTLNVNATFSTLSDVVSATTGGGSALSPAPVATVSVSPATASVTVGQTVQLSATTRDASGNLLTDRAVTWSSGNTSVAAVSASGLVTALLAGSVTVVATSEGQSGTASLTVSAPSAPPPPPPSGGGAWPNAPAGWTTVTNNDFGTGDGWLYFGPKVIQDPSAPESPNVLQFTFPAGHPGGTSPGPIERLWPSGVTSHYVGFWLKLSNPFDNRFGVKTWYPGPDAGYFLVIEGDNKGGAAQTLRVEGGGANWGSNVASVRITPGVWHRIELLVDQSAGKLRFWVDGTLCGDHNIPWKVGPQEARFYPVWGGTGDSMQFQSFMWFDHYILSRP